MKGAPCSDRFDDFYFSRKDGLAETRHVFLGGNGLPDAWAGKNSFSIFETGFGTGLNFFAVWDLFEKTAEAYQTLDFVSVEKYPLSIIEIKEALEPWSDLLKDKIDTLCDLYPIHVRGVHRVKISQQITLTLILDDINEVIPTIEGQYDCWFLDGFTPAKNPDMWSETLFQNMARLSNTNATFATFTVAGDVRRGLQGAGFNVKKQKGFEYKPDMLVGIYEGKRDKVANGLRAGSSVAVIGGGLSGTACAYVLKQYGYEPVIYEASDSLASGASGNDCGFYNPRFTALWDGVAQFFAPAYAQFISMAKHAGKEIDYNPCGALHLVNTPEKEKRFSSMVENWNWGAGHAQIISDKQVCEVSGISLDTKALYLKDAGSVNPKKLCHYYAKDIEVKYNTKITDFDALDEETVIICNAYHAKEFDFIDEDMTQSVRGQITKIKTNNALKDLKANIHYGGYISKNMDGVHATGATFQPWENTTDVNSKDHERNIDTLTKSLSFINKDDVEITEGWAGLRTATKDRFPVVGKIPSKENMFVSLAFGSHGLVGALQSAHILVDLLRGKPYCLQFETKKALEFQRFENRKIKKR